ncbi:Uncharacterised protein [Kingella potus]|uniref:Holin n=1 Tax=Kingella potus TaxID=265175 RepID=A0A377R3C1_9NEIS|nr:holin [Kingella potus]UOP00146.1 hypothetical protein LVJ84_09340 [Kingella potus]STR02793.1 Uncharacterised protein [Kingella potus]
MKPSNLPEIGHGITWTGAIGSFVGAVKSIDLLTVVGALVAVGGFLMNWHYSRQREKREAERREDEKRENARREQIHEMEMAERRVRLEKLKGECRE